MSRRKQPRTPGIFIASSIQYGDRVVWVRKVKVRGKLVEKRDYGVVRSSGTNYVRVLLDGRKRRQFIRIAELERMLEK